MKVKSHSTALSRPESPADPEYSLTTGNATSNLNSNAQLMSPVISNSSQIWTRSAVRAAQLQKLNEISPCHKHHKHGHAQHVIGKIVKPIPVRPMSSSSSSSSTHSSQLSSNFHAKSVHSNLSGHHHGLKLDSDSVNSVVSGRPNFSLIAKYFASFPATRLAKTCQNFSDTDAKLPVDNSTPFLPFKKTSSVNSSLYKHNNANEQVQSTFVLRSQTDHLCTNFGRMIKLNDPESPFFNSIRNASPEHVYANQFNSINLNQNESPNGYYPQTASNLQLPLNQDYDQLQANHNYEFNDHVNDDDNNTTRLGQITMETRSTRKFLIKHHPYLQHNANLPTAASKSNLTQQRPSINLMKKLNSKSSVHDISETTNNDYTQTNNSSSNNRSGRSSRSNNSGQLNEVNGSNDHNLLKFTDSLPSKRRQLKSLTTASALSSEINQINQMTSQTTKRQTTNRARGTTSKALNDSGACEEQCYCDGYEGYDGGENDGNSGCGEYCDEQEEDSSGYYSSYHSVDLVSSSGGSCVGGRHVFNRQLKTANWDSTKPENEHTSILDPTNKSISNNNPNTTDSDTIPQHHYQTRYLTHCLEQKQDQLHHINTTANTSHSETPVNNNTVAKTMSSPSTTSIPTTRLRYQQQLAAQAATSAKFACDLDLDQIEND